MAIVEGSLEGMVKPLFITDFLSSSKIPPDGILEMSSRAASFPRFIYPGKKVALSLVIRNGQLWSARGTCIAAVPMMA